jgi:hypothetical protein
MKIIKFDGSRMVDYITPCMGCGCEDYKPVKKRIRDGYGEGYCSLDCFESELIKNERMGMKNKILRRLLEHWRTQEEKSQYRPCDQSIPASE